MNLWLGLGIVALLLLAASCAAHRPGLAREATRPAEPADAEALAALLATRDRPAVLFVGNSYSFGVPAAFRHEAGARGRRVRTGHSTHGGWTLAQHAAHEPTLRKIRSGRWDVVVLQEQSQLPALPWDREAEMLPAVRALADEARQAGAIPVLYQTWGRRDGDHDHAGRLPADDFAAMQARLVEGYRLAAEAAGGLLVIPAGEAWAREITSSSPAPLFDPDGSHPSPAGDALTARVFADFLLGR